MPPLRRYIVTETRQREVTVCCDNEFDEPAAALNLARNTNPEEKRNYWELLQVSIERSVV